MQVRKLTIAIALAALVLGVFAWAWIDGGREVVHPIVTEAAAPLTSR